MITKYSYMEFSKNKKEVLLFLYIERGVGNEVEWVRKWGDSGRS